MAVTYNFNSRSLLLCTTRNDPLGNDPFSKNDPYNIISSNNSCPSINRLPWVISLSDGNIKIIPLAPLTIFWTLSFIPPCQVEVQCDPAKLISDDSSYEN